MRKTFFILECNNFFAAPVFRRECVEGAPEAISSNGSKVLFKAVVIHALQGARFGVAEFEINRESALSGCAAYEGKGIREILISKS